MQQLNGTTVLRCGAGRPRFPPSTISTPDMPGTISLSLTLTLLPGSRARRSFLPVTAQDSPTRRAFPFVGNGSRPWYDSMNCLGRLSTRLSQAPIKEPGADFGPFGILRSGAAALGICRRIESLNRTACVAAGRCALLLLDGTARSAAAQSQGPSREQERGGAAARIAPDRPADEVIILNGASDVGEFLKKLKQPDLILMKPGTSDGGPATPAAGPAPTNAARTRSHAIGSVKLRGRVVDDVAELKVELELNLLVPGVAWVPLGFDGRIVTSAREGERELELRLGGDGKWEARIEGEGAHRLRLEFRNAPSRSTPIGSGSSWRSRKPPSLTWSSTSPCAVHDVEVGSGESIGKTLLPSGKGTRPTAPTGASTQPRTRLERRGELRPAPPPLLTAQVEIAIDVGPESVTTRSLWSVRCVRGVARKLEIRSDVQDVVVTLKLGDSYLGAPIENNILTIPLAEPLRPGGVRTLLLETRRHLAAAAPRNYLFSGFPLTNAADQSGAIGIKQSANLWVNVTTAQGLRRIDPRELPTAMRTNPGTSAAYQFLDQPFRLDFAVEESPPLYRAEATTRLDLDANMARSSTSIEVHRVRGHLFDIQVAIPPGLDLLSVGPPETVASAIPTRTREQASGGDPDAPSGAAPVHPVDGIGTRPHVVHDPTARPAADGPGRSCETRTLAPRGGVFTGTTVSLFADRNVTFEGLEKPFGPAGRLPRPRAQRARRGRPPRSGCRWSS